MYTSTTSCNALSAVPSHRRKQQLWHKILESFGMASGMDNCRRQPSEDAAVTGRMNVARSKLRDEVFRASQRSFSESSTAPNPHQTNRLNMSSLASFYSGVSPAQPSASSGAAAMPMVLKTALETQITSLLYTHTYSLSKLLPIQHSSLHEKYLRMKEALVAYWLEQYETTGILPQSPYSQLPSLRGHDSGSSVPFGTMGGDGQTLLSSAAPKLDESITIQRPGTGPVYHVQDVAQARGVGNAVWNTYVGIGSGTLDVVEQETENEWNVMFRMMKKQGTAMWQPKRRGDEP